MRRAVSRLSMILGAVLFVTGLAMRAGVMGTVHGAVGPSGEAPSGPVVALATPTGAAATPAPTIAPTLTPTIVTTASPTPTLPPTPEPTATPDAAGELLFADDFDTEAAWPTGQLVGGTARYEDGWYVVGLDPIDLPGYITPAAGDGPLPVDLVVDATIDIAGPDVRTGLFVADAGGGTRIGVLLSTTGQVTIVRDTLESFDVLGSGSTKLVGAPVRLSLVVDAAGTTALVDGHPVAAIHEHLAPASFGLVIWSQTAPGSLRVDHFEARAAR